MMHVKKGFLEVEWGPKNRGISKMLGEKKKGDTDLPSKAHFESSTTTTNKGARLEGARPRSLEIIGEGGS